MLPSSWVMRGVIQMLLCGLHFYIGTFLLQFRSKIKNACSDKSRHSIIICGYYDWDSNFTRKFYLIKLSRFPDLWIIALLLLLVPNVQWINEVSLLNYSDRIAWDSHPNSLFINAVAVSMMHLICSMELYK